MAYPFQLPDLGYEHDALEPHIDARTMSIPPWQASRRIHRQVERCPRRARRPARQIRDRSSFPILMPCRKQFAGLSATTVAASSTMRSSGT